MGELTPAHADDLTQQAIDVGLARALGVRTLANKADLADLGDAWEGFANFPAILFPWRGPDGRVEYQVRPDNPTTDQSGRLRKYLFRRGMVPVLWAVRPVDGAERLLIVEGTKQCLAAATHAPEGVAVYGIAGCRSWQSGGLPIRDLGVVEDREVVVVLDADAAGNLEVYTAGMALAQACEPERATSVKFARLPGGGKHGLDDVLAGRLAERRAGYLAALIDGARTKPADTKPRPNRKKAEPEPLPDPGEGRVVVLVDQDRREVIRALTDAMQSKWSGSRLFNHGGVISELAGATMTPVDPGTFNNLVQDAAMTGTQSPQGFAHGWPDRLAMAAVLARAREFAPLDRVATAPFIRPDGTIRTEAGYDETARTVLVPGDLDGIEVPECPTPAEVVAARDLLLVEWLGDMPLDEPSRANVLALVITPLIRALVPLVPLAVVDGSQMGVGKNLLADCLAILVTGRDADPLPYTADDAEHRKVITSAFRAGSGLFIFDEAHDIEGASFARAITALTYRDRILGVSTMAEFPNRVTWLSLGNNVRVRGDMARRVYRIRIDPDCENPQDRPASSFRHPGTSGLELRDWTRANRAALLRAALLLVRAWFVADRPPASRPASFGSFEAWERIAGGVCELAGVPGFLGNLTAWRGESDFETNFWSAHLEWLREQFGEVTFTAVQVRARAMADPSTYEGPPGLEDPTGRNYARVLGQAYAKLAGRRYDGLQVVRTGHGKGGSVKWSVCTDKSGSGDSDSGEGGEGGNPTPYARGEKHTIPPENSGEDTHTCSPEEKGQGGSHPSHPSHPAATNGHRPTCDQCSQPVPELIPAARASNGTRFPAVSRDQWLASNSRYGTTCSYQCLKTVLNREK